MTAANVKGDRRAVQRAMEAILADSRRAAQPALPGLDRPYASAASSESARLMPERIAELVYQEAPRRRLVDMVLSHALKTQVKEFLFEYSNAALLRSHSLEPRHKVMLIGPPGNGKTSLAEVFATELGLPFLTVRYDAIVDSYLGETSTRVRKLMEFAAQTPCVLFFDEFETVGKERADAQDSGEIKRVVSSLLMQIDRLPSHALVVCATNHPEMLDRAIWRRFDLQLEVPPPSLNELRSWFQRFSASFADSAAMPQELFLAAMQGRSMSEVEAFTLNVRRRLILSQGTLTTAEAVKEVLRRLQAPVPRQPIKGRGERGKRISDHPSVPGGGESQAD